MSKELKRITSSDGIVFLVSKNNLIFNKGIFSELNGDEPIPIVSTSLKYIIENKFPNLTINDLDKHLDCIKPYSLIYHERKCYLKMIKLVCPIKKYNQEMFGVLKLKDLHKIPESLQMEFLEYQMEISDTINSQIISELIFVMDSDFYNFKNTKSWDKYCKNKYVLEYLIENMIYFRWHNRTYLDYILEKCPEMMNKRIFKQLCIENGENLFYASDKIKDNKKIVMIACKNDGKSLKYASERLKDDEEVALIACTNNYRAFNFVSQRMKDDINIYRASMGNIGKYYNKISNIYATASSIVSNKIDNRKNSPCSEVCNLFSLSSDKIKNNISLIKIAIKIDAMCLSLAPIKFQNNTKLAKLACKLNSNVINYLPKKYRKNIKFMTFLYSQNEKNIEHVDIKIKNNVLKRNKENKNNCEPNGKMKKIIYRSMSLSEEKPQIMKRIRKFKV